MKFNFRYFLFSVIFSISIFFTCFKALVPFPNYHLILDMDVDESVPAQVITDVFWKSTSPDFEATRHIEFYAARGRHTYEIKIPEAFNALRIDPINWPGKVKIYRIEIRFETFTVSKWDKSTGFKSWNEFWQVKSHFERDGALELTTNSDRSSIKNLNIPSLDRSQNRIHLYVCLSIAIFVLIVQLLLLLWLSKSGIIPSSINYENKKMTRTFYAWLLPILLSTAGVFIMIVGFRYFKKNTVPVRPIESTGYELNFVNRSGKNLGGKKDGIYKIVIDPFSQFRNYPNQITAKFTVDDRGFRKSTTNAASLHGVLFGGSAAFGVGLNRDSETITSQLNQLNKKIEFWNDGVSGSLSSQELAEMVHYTDPLQSRINVSFDGWNDLAILINRQGLIDRFGFNFQLFSQLESLINPDMSNEDPMQASPLQTLDYSKLLALSSATYFQNILKMYRYSKATGAKYLAVFQPSLINKPSVNGDEEIKLGIHYAKCPACKTQIKDYEQRGLAFEQFCSQNKILFYNMNRRDSKFWSNDGAQFVDPIHLSAGGAKRAAELIWEKLQSVL